MSNIIVDKDNKAVSYDQGKTWFTYIDTSGLNLSKDIYPKEELEHTIGQLIKLQQEYTNTSLRNGHVDKTQLMNAMKRLNTYLDDLLFNKL